MTEKEVKEKVNSSIRLWAAENLPENAQILNKNLNFCYKGNIIEIEDNGRGIPVDIHPKHKKSALEIVTTILHAGGKFEKKGYKVSGGLHGVGISVVNALSEWMEVEVYKEGKVWYQKYHIGKPEEAVKEIGTTDKKGTKVF